MGAQSNARGRPVTTITAAIANEMEPIANTATFDGARQSNDLAT
jgi:hypothetical protein